MLLELSYLAREQRGLEVVPHAPSDGSLDGEVADSHGVDVPHLVVKAVRLLLVVNGEQVDQADEDGDAHHGQCLAPLEQQGIFILLAVVLQVEHRLRVLALCRPLGHIVSEVETLRAILAAKAPRLEVTIEESLIDVGIASSDIRGFVRPAIRLVARVARYHPEVVQHLDLALSAPKVLGAVQAEVHGGTDVLGETEIAERELGLGVVREPHETVILLVDDDGRHHQDRKDQEH